MLLSSSAPPCASGMMWSGTVLGVSLPSALQSLHSGSLANRRSRSATPLRPRMRLGECSRKRCLRSIGLPNRHLTRRRFGRSQQQIIRHITSRSTEPELHVSLPLDPCLPTIHNLWRERCTDDVVGVDRLFALHFHITYAVGHSHSRRYPRPDTRRLDPGCDGLRCLGAVELGAQLIGNLSIRPRKPRIAEINHQDAGITEARGFHGFAIDRAPRLRRIRSEMHKGIRHSF